MDIRVIKEVLSCVANMGLMKPQIVKIRENNTDRLLWQGEFDHLYYDNDFEIKFLEISRRHYKMLSEQWLSTMSCPEFL